MRFVTVRELRSRSAEVWRRLADEQEMVITSNGKPLAILSAVSPEDLEENVWIVRAAVSHDGFHWRVLNEGHNVGPPGEDLQSEGLRVAEEGSTFHPSSLVRQGSSLYFWYGENSGETYRLAAGRLVFDFPR